MKTMKRSLILLLLFCISASAAPPPMNFRELNEKAAEYNRVMSILEYQKYYWKLAEKESALKWDVINSINAIGLFQFTDATLKDLGYPVTSDQFRINPNIFPPSMQFEAVDSLTRRNERLLRGIISKYDGTVLNGTKITKFGILASAHLSGSTGVKNYFAQGDNAKDLNGTTIQDYLIQFSK